MSVCTKVGKTIKFPPVNPNKMQKSASVVVLAAGPSLVKVKDQVQEWQKERSALVIGAHYRYFLKPQYTIFTTPAKFMRAQNKVPGIYIVGNRIKDETVSRKIHDKVWRLHYTKTNFVNWRKKQFVGKGYTIPQGGCGFESIIIASFCKPTDILLAGFDGFELRKNKLIVEHAVGAMIKVKAGRSLNVVSDKKKARYIELEKERVDALYRLFAYFQTIDIRVHVFKKDKFRNIDKDRLKKELNVNII